MVTNISINLNVNFHSKILVGYVQLTIEKKEEAVKELVRAAIIKYLAELTNNILINLYTNQISQL